jgi:hypothetical protein
MTMMRCSTGDRGEIGFVGIPQALPLLGFFESRLQLFDKKALLLLRIGFRGDGSDSSRRHAERVEELPHGARTALDSGELLYLGRCLVDRRRRMLAEIGFKSISMPLQLTCRAIEVEFGQLLDPAGLKHPEVLPQGVTGSVCEPTNLLVRKALALQPQDFHSLAYSRVWMLVPQLLNLHQILLGELDSDHCCHKVHSSHSVATSIDSILMVKDISLESTESTEST